MIGYDVPRLVVESPPRQSRRKMPDGAFRGHKPCRCCFIIVKNMLTKRLGYEPSIPNITLEKEESVVVDYETAKQILLLYLK